MKDKCNQTSCSYNPDNDSITKDKGMKKLLIQLCPSCPKCFAEKWEIEDSCRQCLRCENDPTFIRGRDPMKTGEVSEILKIKEQEENVKPQELPQQIPSILIFLLDIFNLLTVIMIVLTIYFAMKG